MSAADRMAANSVQVGATHFGGQTDANAVFGLLQNSDSKSALIEAQRAVGTAPVDPSTTSALGSALLADNQPDSAYLAFAVAGVLGWRDVPTQFYWLAQAEAAGDIDVVAQRLDALLRLDIDDDAVINSLHVLGQTPAGQAALATLLVGNPPWERRFLLGTSDLEGADLQARLATIDRAAIQGATFDCEASGIAASRLIRSHRAKDAKQLWRQSCDRSGNAILSDGGFETYSDTDSYSPFTWQLLPRGGLDVDVQTAPSPLHGRALRISSTMTARTNTATQLAALDPGSYRVSWATALDNGKPDASVRILVQCAQSHEVLTSPSVSRTERSNRVVSAFSVPAENCPLQIVSIQKAASGLGETRTGWIDDIRIEPADATRTAHADN
jgi:hypothetical protein